jgi:uncharacterized protein (DUF849 family)
VLLQAALNGPFGKDDHPAMPVSAQELARDAAACVAAGAGAVHLHPRRADGAERLDAEVIDAVVVAVREACGVPVGVSTGEWIEPDLGRRLELIAGWSAPDYTSVNLSEDGAAEVMRAVLAAGVGVEAGISTVADVERLAACGLGDRLTRILVEPVDVGAADALAVVDEIHGALDRFGLAAPRLQHGDGEATWILLEDSVRRGIDTRIGLEDTVADPMASAQPATRRSCARRARWAPVRN